MGRRTRTPGRGAERVKNSQRKKEKRAGEAKWLLTLIGEDWGIRVLPAGADELRPVHANVNKRFEAVIGSRRTGRQVASGKSMFDELLSVPWEDAVARGSPRSPHLAATPLPTADHAAFRGRAPGVPHRGRDRHQARDLLLHGRRTRKGETCLTLLMLDVDAHKVGNLKTPWSSPGT